MTRAFDLGVYLITDRGLCGARGVEELVRLALAGGVSLVQLRDPHAKTRELVEQARALVRLLRPAGVRLIINDRVDVALAAGADGVHVGQSDMSAADARALLGPDRILGLSIGSLAELAASAPLLAAVDYLGVGPIFPSGTKPDASAPIGPAGLAEIAARSSLPIVAIGGVTVHNTAEVLRAGAVGVAVVSAICAAPDPTRAALELVQEVRTPRAARGC